MAMNQSDSANFHTTNRLEGFDHGLAPNPTTARQSGSEVRLGKVGSLSLQNLH